MFPYKESMKNYMKKRNFFHILRNHTASLCTTGKEFVIISCYYELYAD